MQIDTYSKVMLTIIAACLVTLVFQNTGKTNKQAAGFISTDEGKTVKVPVNKDGSIEVSLSDEIMDVNVVRVSGRDTRKGLPVRPQSQSFNVNVESVGGFRVHGELPVKRN